MTTPPVPAGSIVVGVDGTPASDRALSWAVAQARARHLGLTVLHATGRHATTAPAEPGEAGGGTASSLRADGRQVTRTAVHSLRRAGFDGAVEELLVPASAVDALVEASTDADLLVVGAREPGPLGTFVLGSVRRTLVDRSRCPVVVVPAPGPSEDGRGVLVAVADQEPSRAALDFAYLQARLTDRPVTVLGCLLESGRVLAGTAPPTPATSSDTGTSCARSPRRTPRTCPTSSPPSRSTGARSTRRWSGPRRATTSWCSAPGRTRGSPGCSAGTAPTGSSPRHPARSPSSPSRTATPPPPPDRPPAESAQMCACWGPSRRRCTDPLRQHATGRRRTASTRDGSAISGVLGRGFTRATRSPAAPPSGSLAVRIPGGQGPRTSPAGPWHAPGSGDRSRPSPARRPRWSARSSSTTAQQITAMLIRGRPRHRSPRSPR